MALLLNLTTWTTLKSLMYINNSCLFLLSQISLSPCFNIHYSLNTIILIYTLCPQAMIKCHSIFLSFLTGSVPPVYYPPVASFSFQFCFSLRPLFWDANPSMIVSLLFLTWTLTSPFANQPDPECLIRTTFHLYCLSHR